mmetsp:Transcript_63420/g.119086  ORF Transcript_63420/g.119086 Transcript_63420/m.119086 type:complete len:292 (-) Transcript_63420:340-1215(-)|eukprot:CAMPEP_0171633206 /NCGR_PEP_ID=MMETSP0990-20121206/25018_1 /TAXON_ID=483369 /ORGANISM="non described non described, Strain CCMP2098" /LENGTH=291 /DNA_ID=CAMNT_0012203785 /DNA_START=15 /DNA_END=890 /DNA_ORIENTATION=+
MVMLKVIVLSLAVASSLAFSALPTSKKPVLNRALASTPQGGFDKAVALGAKKAALSPKNIFILGCASGAHIGLGAWLAISGGGSAFGLAASNPGAQRILMGAFGLPMGLFMTMVGGGELVTGNMALVTAAVLERKATLKQLLKNWSVAFAGNFAGSLLLAALAFTAGTLTGPAAAAPIAIATKKMSLTFAQALTRGILCNWLVCMAVWTANSADDIASKVLAIFLPITGFIALGLEHSVANMFIIPYGMASGASITVADFLLKNLLPVTIGNIIGGAVAVALTYKTVYGTE